MERLRDCPNCFTPEPQALVWKEYRYRPYGLPWVWQACQNCQHEQAPRWTAAPLTTDTMACG